MSLEKQFQAPPEPEELPEQMELEASPRQNKEYHYNYYCYVYLELETNDFIIMSIFF